MAPRKFEKLAVPKTAFETVGFFWAPLERRVIVANICTPPENFNTVEWTMNEEKEIKIVSLRARAPRFAYK